MSYRITNSTGLRLKMAVKILTRVLAKTRVKISKLTLTWNTRNNRQLCKQPTLTTQEERVCQLHKFIYLIQLKNLLIKLQMLVWWKLNQLNPLLTCQLELEKERIMTRKNSELFKKVSGFMKNGLLENDQRELILNLLPQSAKSWVMVSQLRHL
jgi:hypothetical protein